MVSSSAQLPAPVEFNDFINRPDEEYKWLIEGLLEYGDRLILTGNEGKGKSTFLRQFAVQVAAGIHPFTLEAVEPKRVLYVDLENSERQIRRKLAELNVTVHIEPRMMHIAAWPNGVDLNTSKADGMSLAQHIADLWPELVVIGPMYKMASDLETEKASAQLAATLDMLRTAFGFALLMESHQPHQVVTQQRTYRPERPFGSSLWLRWPEFGLCLEDDGRLRHWRGARDLREWPEKLQWGDEWPWVVDDGNCIQCGKRLTGKQDKYCSAKCSGAARQRSYRVRHGVAENEVRALL